MPRRLVLLFDGTWNDPQDQTNVHRLARMLRDEAPPAGIDLFYEPGLGTAAFTRLRGGMFGYGLSTSLLDGYRWLVARYRDGDEIWLFGFSRGAYTARSLAGMIRKCGLLRSGEPGVLAAAEALYRTTSIAPADQESVAFRNRASREVGVHFLGVWDTVGSLGIPGTVISERGRYAWHDTRLSKIVTHAYQALALDEHRPVYDAVLWTAPEGLLKPGQKAVEQRWFIGAHANVGGGYGEDPLADLSFAWMCGRARAAGLPLVVRSAAEASWKRAPRDAYAEFLGGAYRMLRRFRHPDEGRVYRRYAADRDGSKAVNVSVDPSVWQRWRHVPDYRPPTLVRAGCVPPEDHAKGAGPEVAPTA